MLDSQKYAGQSASDASAPDRAPSLDAPAAEAFAAHTEILTVSGAAWAEYHLLLGQSSPQSTRIKREIRSFGGAPTIAVLLARWCSENVATASLTVRLELTLGRDPNARLMRRELESWCSRLPSLRLNIKEDESAPEVAYRILMWPETPHLQGTSTCSAPQVLQCGEIEWRYEIQSAQHALALASSDAAADEVQQAARAWGTLNGEGDERAAQLAQAALRCWNLKPALERIGCGLSWREVEAEAASR